MDTLQTVYCEELESILECLSVNFVTALSTCQPVYSTNQSIHRTTSAVRYYMFELFAVDLILYNWYCMRSCTLSVVKLSMI